MRFARCLVPRSKLPGPQTVRQCATSPSQAPQPTSAWHSTSSVRGKTFPSHMLKHSSAKNQILSSFTHPHVIPNLYAVLLILHILYYSYYIYYTYYCITNMCSCGSVVEHCVSRAQKVVGSNPRKHKYKTCITWMHCKSLWIKASAKCINVNVLIYSVITLMSFQTCKRFFLWWKLKGEFLKNVHAGLLRTIHSDHVCQTSNMTNYKSSIKLAHMHYSTVSKKIK